jgi:serine/threonine protein kinase
MVSLGMDVGGRFRVEEHRGDDGVGDQFLATDLRTNRRVILWVFPSEVLSDADAFQGLSSAVRAAGSLSHRCIVPTLGMGRETDGSIYVARELADGTALSALTRAKSQAGKAFSLRGAYNVLAHVTNALTFAQPRLVHGALGSESVIVGPNGQIVVSDFGLAPLLTRTDSFLRGPSRHFIAPEVVRGEPPTERADVYSLGALTYSMVCGMPPQIGGKPAPSNIQPLLPPELDAFVSRAMDPMPQGRMSDSREFRSLLLALVETWGAPRVPPGVEWPFDDELAPPVMGRRTMPPVQSRPSRVSEIPISWAPPPPEEVAVPAAAPAIAVPPDAPQPGPQREPKSPAIPPPPAEIAAPPGWPGRSSSSAIDFDQLVGARPSPSKEVIDLENLISEATQSENQVWMVHKDHFDHGPFSARELAQQIFNGQIGDDDIVLNMDTGVRQRCSLWPEFAEVLDKVRVRRREAEEVAAARRVQTVEKRVGVLRYLIAAGIIVALGASVGIYFIYRAATRDQTESAEQLADLVEAGDVTLGTGAGVLPLEDAAGGRKSGRRNGRRRPGGGSGLTAEEAMAQGADFGNLDGEIRQLSVGQINSVMRANTSRFYGCLAGHSGRVDLDFVINGDGSVSGVTVSAPDGGVRACMSSRMRGVRFPAFDAPRMRATFWFEVGR